MRRLWIALLALTVIPACRTSAQNRGGVFGDWREPSGGVIHVFVCGNDVCARLLALAPSGPKLDAHNPDEAKRSQPLCDLQIGYGFHLNDPDHADGGHLYDPKSGKTYQGTMTAKGDRLSLRGYVGIKAFGRSEEWTRVSSAVASCHE